MAAKILNVSADISLLRTRTLLLEQAGYEVGSASNWMDFESACGNSTYDLLILGQSLPPSLKKDMEDFAKKHCPSMKIAELYVVAPSSPAKYQFHAGGKPQELLEFVANALKG